MFSSSVDVLVADLSAVEVDEDLLSIPELGRALSFGSPVLLSEYLAVHTWLRRRLAEYLHVPAADIRFAKGEYGKPAIVSPATDLTFNLAYSGSTVALVVGFRKDVGVDVAAITGDVVEPAVLSRSLSAREKMSVLVADDVERAYLQQWVRKESLAKAQGFGVDPDMEATDLSGTSPLVASGYEITDINLGDGVVAAVATPQGTPINLSIVVSEPAPVRDLRYPAIEDRFSRVMAAVGG